MHVDMPHFAKLPAGSDRYLCSYFSQSCQHKVLPAFCTHAAHTIVSQWQRQQLHLCNSHSTEKINAAATAVSAAEARSQGTHLSNSCLHRQHLRPRCICNTDETFVGGFIAAASHHPLSAVRQYTGERMQQLTMSTRHISPFTEVVYHRGPRRWLGLRKGKMIRAERPAPWLLDLQQHWSDACQSLSEVPQRLADAVCNAPQQLGSYVRQHTMLHHVLVAAAVAASLMLLLVLVRRIFQQQTTSSRAAVEDPEVLARKAASLDLQRCRFRRALGAEDDESAQVSSLAAGVLTEASAAEPAHAVNGLDDFEEWDQDTQRQWQRFMQGSRSQEIEEEQWWDIDRDELPADQKVYQDFN